PFGEPKRLTFSNRITTCPVWTASGQEIIFSSGYANSSSLWRIGIAGSSPPQRLASVGGNADEIAISRSGNRLAYSRFIYDTNIWRLELPGRNAKIGVPVPFISSTHWISTPCFHRMGSELLFVQIARAALKSGYAIATAQM